VSIFSRASGSRWARRAPGPPRTSPRSDTPLSLVGRAESVVACGGVAALHIVRERGEAALRDRLAGAGHQLLIELDIVVGEQHGPERLARADEMMQIGALVLRGRTLAFRIERCLVLGVAGVAEIELSLPGEGLTVAARAGRQHAIKHVDAARDGRKQILRRADPHQVAGLVLG